MTEETRKRRDPVWLNDYYTKMRDRTLARVRAAITALLQDGERISLRRICRKARSLDGSPLSESTITSNPAANEVYRAHQTRTSQKSALRELANLCEKAGVDDRLWVRKRFSLLKRKRRSELIRDIIILERRLRMLTDEAATARSEILALHDRIRTSARSTKSLATTRSSK